MKPYRYPQNYVTTQRFLRRHVISRNSIRIIIEDSNNLMIRIKYKSSNLLVILTSWSLYITTF